MKAGDLLSRRMLAIKMAKGGNFDVMLYVAPFTNAVKNRAFQFIAITIGIVQFYIWMHSIFGIQNYGDQSFQRLKFDWSPPEPAQSVSLSLLHRGCETFSKNLSKNENNTISFDRIVHMDGISLTFNGINSWEKVKFSLRGAADRSSTVYYPVGSSDLRFAKSNVRFLDAAVPIKPKMIYLYQPPWPWYVTEHLVTIFWALVCFGTGICGALNAPLVAKRIALWGSCCLSLIHLSCAIGYMTLGLSREAFFSWMNVFIYTTVSAVLKFKEVYFTDACAVLGIFSLITRVVSECIVFQDCPFLAEDPPVSGLGFTILGGVSIVQRYRFFARAVQGVQQDKAVFDATWGEFVAADRGGLDHIDLAARRVAQSCLSRQARHFNRERSSCTSSASSVSQMVSRVFQSAPEDSAADLFSCKSIPGTTDVNTPVTSLDQLYAQSLAVLPILHSHCSRWAECSRGVLDHGRQAFGTAKPHSDLPETANRWRQYRCLKCPSRAIEKALTCYGGDVSRLADICRARIAFDCAADIAACLELICRRSPSVKVARIKNGLDPTLDSSRMGGYRALILNIRFDSVEARHLGIEGHVCEVQLTSKGFVNLLDDNVHSRYLYLRAIRQFVRQNKCKPKSMGPSRVAPLAGEPDAVVGQDSNRAIEVVLPVDQRFPPSELFPWVHDRPQGAPADNLHAPLQGVNRRVSVSVAWDCPLNDWLDSIALRVFQRCSVHAGNILDQKASAIDKAFHQSSTSSVVFTSKPLAAMASKRVFKGIFIFVSVYSTFRFITALLATVHMKFYSADLVRLTVYKAQNGDDILSLCDSDSLDRIRAGVSFGLLWDGCPSKQSGVVDLGNSTSLPFGSPSAAWNGYYYPLRASHTSNSSALIPTAWLLEGSVDNGSTWSTVGASVWRFDSSGTPSFYPNLTHRTGKSGSEIPYLGLHEGARMDIDMRLPLSWIIGSMTEKFLFAVGFMCIALATFSGRATWVRGLWIFLVTLDAVLLTICSVIIMTSEPWMWREAVEALLYVGCQIFLAIGSAFDESRFISTLTVYSFVNLVSIAAAEVILYEHPWLLAVQGVLPSLPFAGLIFGLCIFWSRRRTLDSARRVVMADKQRYDDIWDLYQSDEIAQAAILSVRSIVTRILQERQRQTVLRQLNKKDQALQHSTAPSQGEDGIPPHQLEEGKILNTLDLGNPVDSLDQLFVQAWCLNPILQSKCKAWAWESNGCFPCKGYAGIKFMRYTDVVNVPGLPIKWTSVKSIHRAIEKLVRAYGQDVSRLLDLCRQSIVFESIDDLATCLLTIEADPDVHILRIKNRLDPSYDSLTTAGYRDVELNMRIVNQATVDIGISTHVCEMQLIHQPYAELKSEEGHTRYVAFRNLRGE